MPAAQQRLFACPQIDQLFEGRQANGSQHGLVAGRPCLSRPANLPNLPDGDMRCRLSTGRAWSAPQHVGQLIELTAMCFGAFSVLGASKASRRGPTCLD